MKKITLFITVIVLALVLGAAMLLYPKLAAQYQPEGGGMITASSESSGTNSSTAQFSDEDAVSGDESSDSASKPASTETPEPSEGEAASISDREADKAAESSGNAEGPSSTEGSSPTEPVISENAIPDFRVLDWEGNPVQLYDLLDKPVVINFWATWCNPCCSELPDFDAAYQKYGKDVNFLMVNLTDGQRDTMERVQAFVTDNGFTFPVYFDTEYNAAINYGVSSIPMTVIAYSGGEPYGYKIGTLSAEALEQALDELTR